MLDVYVFTIFTLDDILDNKSYETGQKVLLIVLLSTFIILLFTYIICYTYNTWQLFRKAGMHGWAAIIPIYNSVVFARIAQKNILLGLTLAITSIQPQGSSLRANPIAIISLLLFVYIFMGFIKQYKTPKYFWTFAILFPFIAIKKINSVEYIKEIK